jgi:hypothetical protein
MALSPVTARGFGATLSLAGGKGMVPDISTRLLT